MTLQFDFKKVIVYRSDRRLTLPVKESIIVISGDSGYYFPFGGNNITIRRTVEMQRRTCHLKRLESPLFNGKGARQ
jgi:hypothetical protein